MNDSKKILLVACYRRPYTKQSLKKIKDLLTKEQPDKIVVLSIAETKKSSGTIDSYLGRRDRDTLRGSFEEDQSIRSLGYSDKIIQLGKELNIATEKIIKKGNVSTIIGNAVNQYHPSHVIIHSSNKSRIDKLLLGSIEEQVCKHYNCNTIMLD